MIHTDKETILKRIKGRLKEIDEEREQLLKELENLQSEHTAIGLATETAIVTELSPLQEKTALFRSLFRGREDVYAKLWVSKKSGAKGYSPACDNEWIRGICQKPAIRCGECDNRIFSSLTDEIIEKHLDGTITIGVYPLLQDETCYFLAVDFDRESWQDDARAFMATCKKNEIPALLQGLISAKVLMIRALIRFFWLCHFHLRVGWFSMQGDCTVHMKGKQK